MNSDTLSGTTQDFGGKVKETVGQATGDTSLQGKGIVDQIAGKVQSAVGSVRDGTAGDAVAPLADKARAFARERPFATAALAGVVGIALLNTLRGR